MPVRLEYKVLLSVIAILASLYGVYCGFGISTLPFSLELADAHTLVVHPLAGTALPPQLLDGDRISLQQQTAGTKTLLALRFVARNLAGDNAYPLTVQRETGPVTVNISTTPAPDNFEQQWYLASNVCYLVILLAMALLVIWRGRDLAALGLSLYCLGYLVGNALQTAPLEGTLGLSAIAASNLSFTVARSGFFAMCESLLVKVVSPSARRKFRLAFAVVLVPGLLQQLLAPVLFAQGNATLSEKLFTLPFSWSYIVPLAMVLFGMRHASGADRVKLRWVAAFGFILTASVTVINATLFGFYLVNLIVQLGIVLTTIGLAYALLRHRLVDFSVMVDRALVYGFVTTLVVGILAAVNSLVLHTALPPGAGITVQVVVPLALGIVLGRVRIYMDLVVERVFFRARYEADLLLKRFARQCGQFSDSERLFSEAGRVVQEATGATTVAFYGSIGSGYRRLSEVGERAFPELLEFDDPVAVALRAEASPVGLEQYRSALGKDGVLFPMLVLGIGRGFMVLTDRPGGQYAKDERERLAELANATAAAWRILKARESESLIDALASGQGSYEELRQRAQRFKVPAAVAQRS